MGVYKRRTEFINQKINTVSDKETKRLLSVGFIPDTIMAEYDEFMKTLNDEQDTDLDKISNGNYFSLDHSKIAGTVHAGTGFLNPIIVKGTIEKVVETIDKTIHTTKETPTESTQYLTDKAEIISALTEMASKSKSQNDFLRTVQMNAENFGIDNTSEEFVQAIGLVRKDPERNKRILTNFYFANGVPAKKDRRIATKTARTEARTNRNVENIINLATSQEEEWQQKIKEMDRPKYHIGDYVKYQAGDTEPETWYGIIKRIVPLDNEFAYRIDAFNINYHQMDLEKTNEKYEPQLTSISKDVYDKKLKEWQEKHNTMAKKSDQRIFVVRPSHGASADETKPKIEVTSKDLAVIAKNNLLHDEPASKKTQTTQDTINKYNKAISEDEIKAWVYYKRKFGNPMKGWEKYFMSGGANTNVLLQTTRDTVIKDNKYVDLRTIPANTLVGAKTKFKNTHGTDTLVICKTPTGELVWINTADVKEIKNITSERQKDIDELVEKKVLRDYMNYIKMVILMRRHSITL